MTSHKKYALTWCISKYNVISLKETRGIKQFRECRGLRILGRVIVSFANLTHVRIKKCGTSLADLHIARGLESKYFVLRPLAWQTLC